MIKFLIFFQAASFCSMPLLNLNACKTTIPPDDGLKPLIELPSILKECSGMIPLGNNKLLAHNDSGNKPHLYVFDMEKDAVVRTIKVRRVKNNDWEELADDEDYVYIGDFGNNGGTRQNLMIYKISKNDLAADTVVPEIIEFSYEGQTKFNDSNRHNFDCEAMISKGDSLYLFSKNRGDFRTDVYSLPKIPGKYVTRSLGSYDAEGLVTGADYRSNNGKGELVLVGYSIHGKAYYPFVLQFGDIEGSDFLRHEPKRYDFREVLQTETIFFHGDDEVYITNEEENGRDGFIYGLRLFR